MNEKLVKFLENSEIDLDVKDFIMETLAIQDERNPRFIKKYEDLVDKYVGVDR